MGPVGMTAEWQPEDQGFKAWSYGPEFSDVTGLRPPTTGRVNAVRIRVAKEIVVTQIHVNVSALGGTLTSGQNWLAIYNLAGQLIVAGEATAAFGATGGRSVTVASTTLPPADYFGVIVNRATTLTTFVCQSQVDATWANLNLPVDQPRTGLANLAVTTAMPAQLSGWANHSVVWWMALS